MISKQYIEDILSLIKDAYDSVYVIRLMRQQPWYFFDIKEELTPHGVVWTPHMMQARAFATEQNVEEFKMYFISPRKVEILKIDREE